MTSHESHFGHDMDIPVHAVINTLISEKLDESYAKNVLYELQDMYFSYDRHYHTWQHISQMIIFGVKHAEYIDNIRVYNWATLFHDSIYDSHVSHGMNEGASSEFAATRLSDLLPNEEVDQIKLFIVSSASHSHSEQAPQMDIFLDADLAILGAEPDEYAKYTMGIRKEYRWMPSDRYARLRTSVLSNMLSRQQIFLTPEVYEQLEQRARKNIANELDLLKY